MNNLRRAVYEKLLRIPALGTNIFFAQAPMDALLPYVVFHFPNEGRTHKGQTEVILEINIYDCERGNNNVAEQIEKLTDDINFEFDYSSSYTNYPSGNHSYWFRKISRIAIPYPQESNIWRRELRYNTRTYNI